MQWALVKEGDQQEIVVRKRKDGSSYIKRGQTYDEGAVFYWLVRHVDQKPDPTVLPKMSELSHTATVAMAAHLGLLKLRELDAGGES
jgi:hypothetical protein